MASHYIFEGMRPHYMILEVSWDGLWTLSYGLSRFHVHISWLMCEVALSIELITISDIIMPRYSYLRPTLAIIPYTYYMLQIE
jgi:hypothetical protein